VVGKTWIIYSTGRIFITILDDAVLKVFSFHASWNIPPFFMVLVRPMLYSCIQCTINRI
jgi:hypothetical protein